MLEISRDGLTDTIKKILRNEGQRDLDVKHTIKPYIADVYTVYTIKNDNNPIARIKIGRDYSTFVVEDSLISPEGLMMKVADILRQDTSQNVLYANIEKLHQDFKKILLERDLIIDDSKQKVGDLGGVDYPMLVLTPSESYSDISYFLLSVPHTSFYPGDPIAEIRPSRNYQLKNPFVELSLVELSPTEFERYGDYHGSDKKEYQKRLIRYENNLKKIAEALETHPEVNRVKYVKL